MTHVRTLTTKRKSWGKENRHRKMMRQRHWTSPSRTSHMVKPNKKMLIYQNALREKEEIKNLNVP